MTTTASSLPFSTMDVPVLDDTMEMASPYQGQVDDFDLDLDVMEDQVSNPDKDMTLADDNMDYNNYGANDTDMTDDIAERAMVDAEDQHTDNIDIQYGEEIYEAEMVEENYDEDIDVPVPNNDAQDVPVTLDHTSNQGLGEQVQPADKNVEEGLDETAVESTHSQTWEEHTHDSHHDAEKHDDHTTTSPSQETHPNQTRSDHVEEGFQDANNAERVDSQVHPDGDEVDSDSRDLSKPENKGYAANEVQPPVGETKDLDVQETGEKKVYEQHDQEPTTTEGPAPMHPIKVYYQDNEISLFPPREGDSSEMFFLEDESLAYQDFGKLFNSCRQVLQQSIGDNEILVMDIETLDIQLTEESPHTSRVTLSELVDIYLHLCNNEGNAEPEPLYLTLSTKLTIPAQLSELITAVDEGKGLSEIQPWDDYGEEVPASAEVHESDYHQEADHGVPEQPTSAHEDSHDYESHEVSKGADPSLQAQDVYDEPEEQEAEGNEEPEVDQGEGDASEAVEAESEGHEINGHERDVQEHSKLEDGYDSEAPRTESTATVAQPNLDDEQYAVESGNVFGNNQEAHGLDGEHQEEGTASNGEYDEAQATTVQGEYDETEDVAHDDHELEQAADDGHDEVEQAAHDKHDEHDNTAHHGKDQAEGVALHDEYHETEAPAPHGEAYETEDATPHGDYHDTDDYYEEGLQEAEPDENSPDQFEDNDASEAYDENEPNVEPANESPSSDYHEGNHPGEDWPDGTLEEFEDEDDGALHGDSRSKLDATSQGVSEGKAQEDAEPTDDLVGISEDLKDPGEVAAHANEESEDQIEWAELSDEANGATQTVPDDAEDWELDDEEYLDLGAPDSFEAGDDSQSHENIPTKRAREPEEELELGETPNPETKRRRSS